jgi:KDO2-lipid IV(A) lauroyltransferase
VTTGTAPRFDSGRPPGGPEDRGAGRPASSVGRLGALLRFDGLFWRRLAWLGSVYGPEWWKSYSPPFFAAAIFAVAHRNRRGAAACQARVLGPGTSAARARVAAFRMFREFGYCMSETMELYGPRPGRFRLETPEDNPIPDLLARGHGVILATAHVGNADVAACALRDTGRPVNLVMAREPNETTQDYVPRVRERGGMRVILSDSSVFSSFNMIRALREGEILAIQIDRAAAGPMAPAGVRAVPFFGREATFLEGPFHLARLSGAPIVPVFSLRRGRRRYEIQVGAPRPVSRKEPGDAERALRETVALLEETIRRHPEQWFQFTPPWS